MTAGFAPSVELPRLYERTSARGTRYMVGRLDLARITLLPGDAAEDGTDADLACAVAGANRAGVR